MIAARGPDKLVDFPRHLGSSNNTVGDKTRHEGSAERVRNGSADGDRAGDEVHRRQDSGPRMSRRQERQAVLRERQGHPEGTRCPSDGEGQKGLARRKDFPRAIHAEGEKPRVALGSCSAVTLANARKATAAIMGAVAHGRNPAAERKAAAMDAKRDALTLATMIDQWERLHLAGKRPNYSVAAASALRRSFAKYLDRPPPISTEPPLFAFLTSLAKDDKAPMAGATARYGSALFGWANRRGTVSINPFERVPIAPPARRDRILADDEIRLVWAATEGPGAFNAIVRALLLTGQRREEMSGQTWARLIRASLGGTCPPPGSKKGNTTFRPAIGGNADSCCAPNRA